MILVSYETLSKVFSVFVAEIPEVPNLIKYPLVFMAGSKADHRQCFCVELASLVTWLLSLICNLYHFVFSLIKDEVDDNKKAVKS